MMRDLTTMPVLSSLVGLTYPMIASGLLRTVYFLADTFWVGRLGTSAVASISLSFPLMWLMIVVGAGLSTAATILVAQHKGARQQEEVDRIASQSFSFMLVLTLTLTLTGYVFAPSLIALLGAPPEVWEQALSFVRTSFLGLIFFYGMFLVNSLMRGVGDVKTPLYIMLASVILNVILDPFLILGWAGLPQWGVQGAAIATVCSQALAFIVGFGMLWSGSHHIHVTLQLPSWKYVKKFIDLGLPASLEQGLRALCQIFLVGLVATFGTTVLAAYGVAMRVINVLLIPSFSLGNAVSTMVGQNLGAKKIERAMTTCRIGLWLAFGAMSGMALLITAFAPFVIGLFIKDTLVIVTATKFLRTIAISFGFVGILIVANGTFRGSGNTKTAMAFAVISLWLLRYPLAVLFSRVWGANGIWWAFAVANMIAAGLALAWLVRGTWQHKTIVEQ